jgi:hypothetical protein
MASAEYAPLLGMFGSLDSRVKELDEILDAASDQKGAGRRAVINQLVTASQETIDSVVAQFIAQLGQMDDEKKYGVYFGVLRGLRGEFDEPGTQFAESLVEQRPQITVDPAEVLEANNERSDKVGQMKHLKAILEAVSSTDPELAEEVKGLKVPRRRSTGGPRGKRAISYYSWTIDGAEFDGNLTEVAKKLGYARPADLRDEMKVAEINLTKPKDVIEFTTSGGNVLVGTKDADAPDWEDVPDEAEDDEDEDDDETNEVSELANI